MLRLLMHLSMSVRKESLHSSYMSLGTGGLVVVPARREKLQRLYIDCNPATCGAQRNYTFDATMDCFLINPFAAADIALPFTTPPLALRFFTNEISLQSSSRSKGGRPRGKTLKRCGLVVHFLPVSELPSVYLGKLS